MDKMAPLLVLEENFFLHLLSLIFIFESHFDKSEATSSHGGFVSHNNLVCHRPELRKILEKIRLYINNIKMEVKIPCA
jgi:hypothetical protein